ncbi:MAG: tetratricopeptide repeat protein [Parachlamydiales bacterium]|nr:tetratricopeptide repeat protein [Parachlamydiales bacterium]
MFKFWILFLPFLQLVSYCRSCTEEISIGIPSQIACTAIDEARENGCFFPSRYSLGYCCYSYSKYRNEFLHLIEYAEKNYNEFNSSLSAEIDEMDRIIAKWKADESKYALEQIAWYEPIVNRKKACLIKTQAEQPIALRILSSGFDNIANACNEIYTFCIENHNDTGAFYQRGLIYYDQGKYFESVNDIARVIGTQDSALKNLDYYLIEGMAYSQVGLYDEAIAALNQSLSQNPNNKEAFLERAVVYFETGNFEQSIQDFLSSGIHSKPLESSRIDFATGFYSGSKEGFKEFGTEFFPGLLSSAKGLGSTLWMFADPLGIKLSEEMYNACNNFIQFVSTHSLPEIVEAVSPKLKALIYDSDSLSLKEKGEYLGYLIAKNGVEVIAFAGASKAYQEIRKANAVLTLETLSTPGQKTKVIEKAVEWGEKHSAELKKMRENEAYIKTLRGQNLSEATIRKTLHEMGYKTFPRPKGLPDSFIAEFSQKNGGMVYFHPQNRHTNVRVMPGDPKSPNVWQHNPYIEYTQNGNHLDKYGNKFDSKGEKYTNKHQEIHIPIEDFVYLDEWK